MGGNSSFKNYKFPKSPVKSHISEEGFGSKAKQVMKCPFIDNMDISEAESKKTGLEQSTQKKRIMQVDSLSEEKLFSSIEEVNQDSLLEKVGG